MEDQIKNPASVAEMLELAIRASYEWQRVILYYACEFPELNGKLTSHRRQIAELLPVHARKIGQAVSVVEWPGGVRTEARLAVEHKVFSSVMNGRKSIPFGGNHS